PAPPAILRWRRWPCPREASVRTGRFATQWLGTRLDAGTPDRAPRRGYGPPHGRELPGRTPGPGSGALDRRDAPPPELPGCSCAGRRYALAHRRIGRARRTVQRTTGRRFGRSYRKLAGRQSATG